MTSPGVPVVLTADRTLTAAYDLLFDGMLAASQTTLTPSPVLTRILAPPHRTAVLAPLGLRRIEAALLRDGFAPDEVALVPDHRLPEVIGPATRVVAVSAGEPCGRGMSSTTMTGVLGGSIYPRVMLQRLLRRVRRLIAARAPRAQLLLGGPGAWQLASDAAARAALGINHVVTGYAEANAAEVFRSLLTGRSLPAVIAGAAPDAADIPALRGPSTMGVIEISRGCGLGCEFCTLAHVPMRHLPADTIISDAATNLAAGQRALAVLSEDLFRYGGTAARPAPEALIALLERLRALQGMGLIQCDHANITSVAAFSDAQLRRVRDLLVGDTGCRYPWVNLGVETASGSLLARIAPAKLLGLRPEEWAEVCHHQIQRLIAAGWLPMVSIMLGLPGETAADLRLTLDWVRSLRHQPVTIFPVLYAPIDGSPPVTRADLTRLHWQLIAECYALNFRWVPRMYWDNQTAVGVPLAKRLLLQGLGRGQVLLWRSALAWRRMVARP